MSEIYKLSGFQRELDKAERFFSMHLTRQELKSRLDEIEDLQNQLQQKENIIKEVREYAKDNQFTAHLDIQTNKVTKIENGEMTDILEILNKE